MKIVEAIAAIAELPISTQALLPLLMEYKRPYDKIEQLVNAGYLYQLKRGLYVAGPKIKTPHPELFLIANHLYGPSYVTAESALSYWGLIPEKVTRVNSVTTRKSKVFKTALGDFYYHHVPQMAYFIGLCQVKFSNHQTVIMASPEKALCDLIIQTRGLHLRSVRQTIRFLEEDLRLDMNALQTMNANMIADCVTSCPKSNSL
ncbi:MAG: hypothetical protein Q7U47_11310, partial [Paludibacter sp.]|nr:hypothetical protein [Paludibacter sp.]